MIKKSVNIKGHSTSVSLEKDFWEALQYLAICHDCSINQLIATIDGERSKTQNLSSSIRSYILKYFTKFFDFSTYEHFKGGRYLKIGDALNVHNEKMTTIYAPLYKADYKMFARDKNEFEGKVARDGGVYQRFALKSSKKDLK